MIRYHGLDLERLGSSRGVLLLDVCLGCRGGEVLLLGRGTWVDFGRILGCWDFCYVHVRVGLR